MLTKKITAAAVLILLVISLAGCSNLPTAGNGQTTDGSYTFTGAVSAINITGVPATVNLTPDSTGAVTYTIDENLKPLLDISYQDGTLNIATKNGKSIVSDKIVLNIGADSLAALSVDGAADIQGSGTFTADSFDLKINGAGSANLALAAQSVSLTLNGAGDITLSGAADTLSINSSGAAKADTRGLIAQDVTVALNGVGSIQLHAEKTLDATVNGMGSVTYWGDPVLSQSTQGLASVKKGG